MEGDAEGTLKKALENVLSHNTRSSTSVAKRGRQTAGVRETEVTPEARWVGQGREGKRVEGTNSL